MTEPGRARIATLYAAIFLGMGVGLPFFPVWLAARGLDADAIGLILSASILVRVAASLALTALADRGAEPVRLLAALNGLAALVFLALHLTDGFAPILALTMIGAVAQSGLIALTDLVATRGAAGSAPYGRVRLWGSVGFVAGNLAGGVAVAQASPESVVLLQALAAGLAGLASLAAPTRDRAVGARDATSAPLVAPRAGTLALVIAAAALIQASHAALYGFSALDWDARGVSPTMVGGFWALGVAAEIALFGLRGGLASTLPAALGLMALGGFASLLRWGVMASGPGLGLTLLLQTGHALSFAVTHLGTLAALQLLAPPGARARSQGMLAAGSAAANAVATMLAGRAFEVSGWLAYAAMLPIAAAGLVCVGLAAWRGRGSHGGQPQSVGSAGWTRPPS